MKIIKGMATAAIIACSLVATSDASLARGGSRYENDRYEENFSRRVREYDEENRRHREEIRQREGEYDRQRQERDYEDRRYERRDSGEYE